MLCRAPAASSVASKPSQSSKLSSTAPCRFLQSSSSGTRWAPQILCWSAQPHLSSSGQGAGPSTSSRGCRHTPSTVGGLSGSLGAAPAGEGTQRVSTGLRRWWGCQSSDWTAEGQRCSILLCPCSLVLDSITDACPWGQSSSRADRWRGRRVVRCLGRLLALLAPSSSPEEVPSHWGQRWGPEPAQDDKGHLSATERKPNWKQTVWLMTLSLCMKVLVSCKQMYSEAVLRVTKSNIQNTQKKAKFIISLAPPYLLLRREINSYWKIQTKMLKSLYQQLLFFNWLCWLSWFCVVRGAPYLKHRVAGHSKSKTSFLLI